MGNEAEIFIIHILGEKILHFMEEINVLGGSQIKLGGIKISARTYYEKQRELEE